MRLHASQLVLSPTDLAAFLTCRHRTGLDLAVAHGELVAPAWRDPLGQAFRDRGLAHERAYVEWLRGQGLAVVDLADGPDGEREARTVEALRAGADAICQAVLAGDGWHGQADVLVRVPGASALGAWSYEVHDTKLARETRGGTVLQLAVYSDLLGGMQGRVPERFHVVAPGGETSFEVRAYRVGDFAAYVRRVRAELLHAVGQGFPPSLELRRDHAEARRAEAGGSAAPPGAAALHQAHYPEPVEACGLCRWSERCEARRRGDDHLSFIAGIHRAQRTELTTQGHATLAAVASMPLPVPFTPRRGSRETYARLGGQARVQQRQRETGAPVHELLLPVEAGLGLGRLPAPSPGDIFLDLEGARFARDGGREYLFGIWTAAGYRAWWAHDDAEERAAFEAVIDYVMQAWAADPGLHVYHFGHYEPSAFKRLMGRHATRGDELDRLLRAERFVDLHAVVRRALRAGVESYSIKQLEQFYGFARAVPLDDAAAEMQAIELALEAHGPGAIDPATRAAVEGYNADDCRSTSALRDWLERLRADLVASGVEVPRPTPKPPEPPAAVTELEAAELAASARLLDGLATDAHDPAHPQHPRWLLAQLLGWHRREDKAQWWERFRLNALADDDLVEEAAAIAGLSFVERVRDVVSEKTGRPTGSVVDRYTYPAQECEIGRRGELLVRGPDRAVKFGDVVAHDRHARLLDVKKGRATAETHPSAVFEAPIVHADVLRRSLLRLCGDGRAEALPYDALTYDESESHGCGLDLLHRRPPRLTSGHFAPLVFETSNDFAVRLATTLDRSTLPVQGPPGSGKTYIGAQMIRALVRDGRKVGVVAVSHKVIRNLLHAVLDQAAAAGETVRLAHKCDPDDDAPHDGGVREIAGNPEALRAIADGEVDVLGGTAWLWAREEFAGVVDVLFVDEAGQMSLADALAVSPAASSLVLLGDPQQLQQPQQAHHPDGVDLSALQHVLGDHPTMPLDRGLFLDTTWRLAPSLCAFTSELFYDGKLQPREGLEQQRLIGTDGLDGAGPWWLPVPHDGNRHWSPEEVDAVATLVDRLLAPDAQWVNGSGEPRPLTADDLRIVAPYNAHVSRLAERLAGRGIPVGTVDRFQGQEAAVVVYAMGTSRAEDTPRGLEFLYSLHRLNVATSRARCAVVVVASPRLLEPECRTPDQMRLANALCRYVEVARPL
ncbi:MAG: TM0106 family RecB-like putative nuclease [Vicinamibacterales bacterium]